MQIGDEVVEKIYALDESKRGKVVYIHPESRFHVVEFEFGGGKFREAFPGPYSKNQYAVIENLPYGFHR